MKTKLAVASFLVASCSSLFAASVSVDLFTDTIAKTSEGTLLNSSFTAKIGFYSGGAIPDASGAYNIISSNWTQVGEVAFATGAAANYNGYFSTGTKTFTDAQNFGGKQIWVWLTNGLGLGYNALFTAPQLGTFKTDSAIPNSGSASISASNAAQLQFIVGSYSASSSNAAGGGAIILQDIPEVSTALLGAIGALGLLRHRRI